MDPQRDNSNSAVENPTQVTTSLWITDGRSLVETVHPDNVVRTVSRNAICVTGSTVGGLNKIDPDELAFDAIVVNAGSQLKASEAAMPIRRLPPSRRLLIAGDDKQLAPIVLGRGPTEEGEPLLHPRILECLRDRDPSDAIVTPLLKNLWMCGALCEHPRSSIHPDEYGPVSEGVAQRR